MKQLRGLHHVTAISGPAQENLDFYAGVLGMRLVKKSVNQDDPGTYHLFYADAEGHPGTDLTFFPWAQMAPSRDGHGLSTEVSLAVPPGSLVFWSGRLQRYGVAIGHRGSAFRRACPAVARSAWIARGAGGERDSLGRPFTPWERQSGSGGASDPRLGKRADDAKRSLPMTTSFLEKAMGFRHLGDGKRLASLRRRSREVRPICRCARSARRRAAARGARGAFIIWPGGWMTKRIRRKSAKACSAAARIQRR